MRTGRPVTGRNESSVTVTMKKELMDALKIRAFVENRSLASYIRNILQKFIEKGEI